MFRIKHNRQSILILFISLCSCQQAHIKSIVQRYCDESENIRCDSIEQSLVDSLMYCFYVYNTTSVLTSNLCYPSISNLERDVFIPVEENVIFEGYSVFGDSAINYYFTFRHNDTIRLENNFSHSDIGTIRIKPNDSIIYFCDEFLDANYILPQFEYSSERCRREWIKKLDIFCQKETKYSYKYNTWLVKYLSNRASK